METVLVPGDDHNYREAYVTECKVIWNNQIGMYFEYHGDEYLDDGDEVVIRKVAE